MQRVAALEEEMDSKGVPSSSVEPSMGPMRRPPYDPADPDVLMTDGPFVEAKEHIAGFYIINAEDLDEALVLGAQGGRGDQTPDRGAAVCRIGARRGVTGAFAPSRVTADVERVFREVLWSSAVATLVRVFGDIQLAEDAVQDAFLHRGRALAQGGHSTQSNGLDHHHLQKSRDRRGAPGQKRA